MNFRSLSSGLLVSPNLQTFQKKLDIASVMSINDIALVHKVIFFHMDLLHNNINFRVLLYL